MVVADTEPIDGDGAQWGDLTAVPTAPQDRHSQRLQAPRTPRPVAPGRGLHGPTVNDLRVDESGLREAAGPDPVASGHSRCGTVRTRANRRPARRLGLRQVACAELRFDREARAIYTFGR